MQQLAHRLERLGTETAFSVAQAAAAWKAKGNLVYPFHLGDINIPTAPHIVEAMNRAIADGYTGYCPGPGIPQLREALADDHRVPPRYRVLPRQRRRDDGRQARHHEVPAGGHEPRPGSALPQPRLPDLRIADRVPRRHGRAVPLPAHEPGLRDRPRPDARIDHPEHGRNHLQRPAEPHLGRVDGGRA